MRRHLLPLVLLTCFSTTQVLAQGRDPAGAEKLYDDGAKLMAANDWAGACAKFEQSFALDAAPGTLLNLASCAEHDGKIALAWSRLKDARSLNLDTKSETRKKQIDSFVNAAITRLEPRLPYLTVKVKAASAGVTVTRDGQPTAIDVELPIDPGKHVIEASATGFKTTKKEVVSAEGARATLELELEVEPKGPPPIEPKDPPVEPPVKPLPPPAKQESSGLSTLQIGGIVIGAVGIATLGATIATGVMALEKQSELDELGCTELDNGNLGCAPGTAGQAGDISSSGATLALVSTVTTFVGAGMVGAGVLMFVLGGNGESEKAVTLRVLPAAGPGHAALWLTGSF